MSERKFIAGHKSLDKSYCVRKTDTADLRARLKEAPG